MLELQTDSNGTKGAPGKVDFNRKRHQLWEDVNASRRNTGKTYHSQIRTLYRQVVPARAAVLELGCGCGDLLNALEPSVGVGIDWSSVAVVEANNRYPQLTFIEAHAEDTGAVIPAGTIFDYVIVSDLLNDLWDVQSVLNSVRQFCSSETRIVGNSYRSIWGPLLGLAQRLKLMQPLQKQNWLSEKDVHDLLNLERFEMVKSWREILIPFKIPVLASLLNRFAARMWPFSVLNLTQFFVARPIQTDPVQCMSVSIVVPTRNERGNIEQILQRLPDLGPNVEVIFVEGGSTDGTYEEIERLISEPQRYECSLLRQRGEGKGAAVRDGFAAATGDILIILDADLTVPPESLPRFVAAIAEGHGEFINGVRLVYPMQDEAMQSLNRFGNVFFSYLFSKILRQPVRDTLCGTKVLRRTDYNKIARGRERFGTFDPFGDFDLLFGASALNLKITDLPVRYQERTFGQTNIRRWVHGLALIRMSLIGLRKLRFTQI